MQLSLTSEGVPLACSLDWLSIQLQHGKDITGSSELELSLLGFLADLSAVAVFTDATLVLCPPLPGQLLEPGEALRVHAQGPTVDGWVPLMEV